MFQLYHQVLKQKWKDCTEEGKPYEPLSYSHIFSIHIMYLDCWAQSALNAQWKQDLCLNQNKADEWRKGMHTAGWRSLRQRGNKAVTHICTKFYVLCIMREHSTVHLWINSYNHSLFLHFETFYSWFLCYVHFMDKTDKQHLIKVLVGNQSNLKCDV